MPEENLTYRIQLDDADLGTQLEQVRNRIDIALGTDALKASPLPQGSDLVANFGTMPGAFEGAAAQFGSQVDAQFWQSTASGGGMNVGSMLDRVTSTLDRVADNMQMGYGKFNEDMRRYGLINPIPNVPLVFPPGIGAEALYPRGMMESTGAFLSGGRFGYTPTGPVSRGEYRERAAMNVERATGNFISGNMFTALGAPFGPIGLGIGMTLDFGLDATTGFMRQRENVAQGLVDLAKQNALTMGLGEARGIAEDLQAEAFTPEGLRKGMSFGEMQESLVTFGEAGGFQYVRGTDDFRQRIRGVLDNVRQVQYDLNVFSDEAVQIMGELQKKMLATSNNIGDVTSRVRYISEITGVSPTEVLGVGIQGAEMVRGTGIGMEAGFNLAVDARLQAERLARSGNPDTQRLIADYGGPAGAGLAISEGTTRWMLSGQGMLTLGGMLGGAAPGTGLVNMLGGAGRHFSDPANLLATMAGAPEMIGNMSQDQQFLTMMGTVIDSARLIPGLVTGPGGTIRPDVLKGYMMNTMGVSQREADLMVTNFQSFRDRDFITEIGQQTVSDLKAYRESNYVGRLEGAWNNVRGFFGRLPATIMGDIGETRRDISDAITNTVGDWLRPGTMRLPGGVTSGVTGGINKIWESGLFSEVETQIQTSDAFLQEAIDTNYQNFIEATGGPGRLMTVGPRSLSRAHLDLFKRNAVGRTMEAQERLFEDIDAAAVAGVAPYEVSEWLDNVNEFENTNVDTSSGNYMRTVVAFEGILLNEGISGLGNKLGNRDTKESKEYIAQVLTGKSFGSMSNIEKAAMNEAVGKHSDISTKIFGNLSGDYGTGDLYGARVKAGMQAKFGEEFSSMEDALTAPIPSEDIQAFTHAVELDRGVKLTNFERGDRRAQSYYALQIKTGLRKLEKRTAKELDEGIFVPTREAISERLIDIREKEGADSIDYELAQFYYGKIGDRQAGLGMTDPEMIVGGHLMEKYADAYANQLEVIRNIEDPEARKAAGMATVKEFSKDLDRGGRSAYVLAMSNNDKMKDIFDSAAFRTQEATEIKALYDKLAERLAPDDMKQLYVRKREGLKDVVEAGSVEEKVTSLLMSVFTGDSIRVSDADALLHKPQVPGSNLPPMRR